MLEVEHARAGYDGRRSVVLDANLKANSGEFVALLGANGVGKSTLLRSLTGLCRWQGGDARFGGENIAKLSPRARLRRGIALVPQGHDLFLDLTCVENINVGSLGRSRKDAATALDRTFASFPILRDRRGQLASTLSGGERALLAVARAMVSSPTLLLLDEPSLGLSPGARHGLFAYLKRLSAEQQLTIVLAEQDAKGALEVADICYGMRNGRTVGWLDAKDVSADRLRELYLTGHSGEWGNPNVHPTQREASGASQRA